MRNYVMSFIAGGWGNICFNNNDLAIVFLIAVLFFKIRIILMNFGSYDISEKKLKKILNTK